MFAEFANKKYNENSSSIWRLDEAELILRNHSFASLLYVVKTDEEKKKLSHAFFCLSCTLQRATSSKEEKYTKQKKIQTKPATEKKQRKNTLHQNLIEKKKRLKSLRTGHWREYTEIYILCEFILDIFTNGQLIR